MASDSTQNGTPSNASASAKASESRPAAKPAAAEEPKRDDDVVGKVYDGRLMRRLVRYLRPYKLQVTLSAIAIIINAGRDVLGPSLAKVAADTYFAPSAGSQSWLGRHLSPDPARGVTEIGLLYLA